MIIMSALVICPLPVVSPIGCKSGVHVVVRLTFIAKDCVTPWRVTETLKLPVTGATFRNGRVARTLIVAEFADHSTEIYSCIAAGILFVTEIFPVAVPPTVVVTVRFVSEIFRFAGTDVNVTVEDDGVKFVTTVVPFSAIEFVFRIVLGSVTAHAKEFVAPAAELKFAGGVQVIARGDCVEVGVVVIAAVAGSCEIAPAAFVTAEVSVRVAPGEVSDAKFGAVVVKFVTVTAQERSIPWRVTVTLKLPFNAAMSMLGRVARIVIVEDVGDHSTEI